MEEEERERKNKQFEEAKLPEKRAQVAMKFGSGKDKTPDGNGLGAAASKKAKPIVGKMPGRRVAIQFNLLYGSPEVLSNKNWSKKWK